MMTSKSALASDNASEQTRLYTHASHLARTLLASHTKHNDLPLVMHAHTCMVLGCSDAVDCYEMMEQALDLVEQAVGEGVLGDKEAAEMRRCCRLVMGMKEQEMVGEGEDGEESGGSGDDGDGVDEGEEGEDELP